MRYNSRSTRIAWLLASTLLTAPSIGYAMDNSTRTVGPQSDGSIVASNNQTLTPAGRIVDLGSNVVVKAVAVNPNPITKTAAVLLMGAAQPIMVFNTTTHQVIQTFSPTTSSGDTSGSFTGITYSPDGTKLFFSQDGNHFVVANVNPATGMLTQGQSVTLPPPPAGKPYYNSSSINPGGIAMSGAYAYVVLNAANELGVINLASGSLAYQIPVGNAPNSVVINGKYAYVSNEGGRPATGSDFTNYSDGTPIVVDQNDAFAITGTVSVVDLTTNTQVQTINVGLHPAGMTISGSNLYVANSYSDTISVIDLNTNKVVRTIKVGVPIKSNAFGGHDGFGKHDEAANNDVFGAGPNGIAVVNNVAYVTLGQSNAIAVVNLQSREDNAVVGYIPTAYFPTSIAFDPLNRQLVVGDDKGLGAHAAQTTLSWPDASGTQAVTGYNSHIENGVVNLIPLPAANQLAKYTQQVMNNNHWDSNTNIEVGPEFADRSAQPVAIPQHIGEPSLIKHVFLFIKENRTYDQMLGDVAQGNGDASLAVFGGKATPNQHAFVQRFPLLDNVYAPSRQSADGHPWIVSSGSFYSNDILSPDWIRSYPGGNDNDALTYTPKGFLWSAAQAKGLSVKLYGEWSDGPTIATKADGSAYSWNDFYQTAMCKEGKLPSSYCIVPDGADTEKASVPSAAKILDPHYPSFNLGIPDQYRADYWIPAFQQQVATSTVPNLTIIWLPDDHTQVSNGAPWPVNYQADNDLALGRMVEAITKSAVWKDTAIFVEEDDAQNGVDHVDAHRQPVYVISPYTVSPQAANQGKVIHTTYTAENINRTIENILGMEPLTQFDLVASPMFDVFQNKADLTPYTHQPAQIPLNQGPGLPGDSYGDMSPLQKAWVEASTKMMKGIQTKPDAADVDFLNHAIWYSATHWMRPYPGETDVKAPDAFVKAAAEKVHDNDGDED